MGVLGLDPLAYLNSTSSFERGLMQKLAERMWYYQDLRDQNLANKIGKAIGG